MRARDVMTNDAEACEPEDTLRRAAEIMWNRDCGSVPVVDKAQRVAGIVTDRDICMAAYTRGAPIEEITVGSAMAEEVWTCSPTDTLEGVEHQMRERRIRRLPVVDAQGRLVGMVTLSDLAIAIEHDSPLGPKKSLDKQRVADTLAAICERRVPTHA